MIIKYSSQDLPEHGLIIVKPSDPEFNDLAAALLSGQKIPEFEKIKPFAVFLKNNSTKTVVGHSVVWQLTNSTGKKTGGALSYINSPALTDGVLNIETDENLNESIPAGGYNLLTYAPINSGSAGGGGGSPEIPEPGEPGNENEVSILLSGVFFEDGLFVGPDTTKFFSLIEAHVRAKRDLISYIDNSLKKGDSLESLNKDLMEKIEIKSGSLSHLVPEGYYNNTTKMFANFYLRLSKSSGKEGLTAEINKFKSRSLPCIRKL